MDLITALEGLRVAQDQRRKHFSIQRAGPPSDWGLRDGAVQHRSGGFFSISGYAEPGGARQHLMLHQPQGAVNGWVGRRIAGRRDYLVQARAEPGNVDGVQFGPALQSTPANYLRLHGGSASAFAELFLNYAPHVTPLFETQQLDQGGRYAQKTKRVAMVETDRELALPRGYGWASAQALVEAAGADFLLNTDFKAGLGVLPWSADPNSGELTPKSQRVRDSLSAPLRPEVLGSAITAVQQPFRPLDPVPLEALTDWRVTADGIEPATAQSGLSVGYYECTADAREVRRWTQPLMRAGAPGCVALACRVRQGRLEVFIGTVREPGLPTGSALGPSFTAYPGAPVREPAWMAPGRATPWIKTRESDEGGRFIDHWSRYRVLLLAPGTGVDAPGTWMTVAEVKSAMMISNLCTIQLRTICALLLAAPERAP